MIKVSPPVRIDISAGWSDADPFRREFGGAVLNAAINLRVSGTLKGNRLITSLENAPSNSGLGTSGALRTVFLVASNPVLVKDKIDLIKRVNILENAIIGQRAGFQDQAAAIFGGVNYWEFKKDDSIKRIEVEKKKAKHLFDRLVLVFTGDKHLSSDVHSEVFDNNKFMKEIFVIERMKEISKEMLKNLDSEPVMANLIKETWELQKKLHESMETKNMKKIQEIGKENYLACRATGAGGGGCMIFYTNKKRRLIKTLKNARKEIPKMKILPFEFDYKGIVIEKND